MNKNTINKQSLNIPFFSQQCFWDMDYSKLDFDKDKNFIISRVISMGSTNDENELFQYYGWDVIKEEVIKIKYLNKKIHNYLSLLFDIDKKYFRCNKNRRLF